MVPAAVVPFAPSTGLARAAPPAAARPGAGANPAGGAGCLRVLTPAGGTMPHAPLLLDQCSGASWLLACDPVQPAQPVPASPPVKEN